MAGKKGMRWGAKIISPTNVEQLRISIEAEKIIASLKAHALGTKEMTPSQVAAGLGLVRKVLPDMTVTEHSGETNLVISIAEPKATLAERLVRQADDRTSEGRSLVSVQ
jgi:hypothetical protein